MKKQNLKNKKGITLIALVVTVVVLLILAGVSISMLTGDNGIITQAQNAKENTRGAKVKEIVDLAVIDNELTKQTNGTQKSKQEIIDKLVADKKLTDEEVEILKKSNTITIGTIEIDFSELSDSEKRNISVQYTKSEGEDLWNSTITLNISLGELTFEEKKAKAIEIYECSDYEEFKTVFITEANELLGGTTFTYEAAVEEIGEEGIFNYALLDVRKLTFEERKQKMIELYGCSSYDEFKIAICGTTEAYDQAMAQMGEEYLLFLAGTMYNPDEISLKNKRDLVAYMYDFDSYEEFMTWVQGLEVTMPDGINTEEDALDYAIEIGKNLLNYKDIEKLESLGVKVISVKTPYNTTLYTTSLGGEVSCTFMENGTYTFDIQSGDSKVEQTIEISNIRDYNEQAPHEIKVDFKGKYVTSPMKYSIDESEEWTELSSSTILNCNDSISFEEDVSETYYYWLNYVEKDKEYYKYFRNDNEWDVWCEGEWDVFFGMVAARDGLTVKQNILRICCDSNVVSSSLSGSLFGDYVDYLNDKYINELSEDELYEKYPKLSIGIQNLCKDEISTINYTKDTNICIYKQITT